MRLQDLAVLATQDRRKRPVQHTGAAIPQRRTVLAGLKTLARGLDPDQADLVVVDKAAEDADRVGATAHTGDYPGRQPPSAFHCLLTCLIADHPLQIADQLG